MDQMISVITPTYNRSFCIKNTIDSVLSQTYSNWELIIVDDGSTDNTREVIEPFLIDKRIRLYQRPPERPSGGGGSRNYGLEVSQGMFIKWLDSDDLLDPNCLSRQLEALTSSNSDVCFCQSELFTEAAGSIVRKNKLWSPYKYQTDNVLLAYLKGQVRWSVSAGLWKRDIMDDKPFHEGLKSSQEWLMILSILLKSPKIVHMDQVLEFIRVHERNMVASRNLGSYLRNQVWGRMLASRALGASAHNNISLHIILFKTALAFMLRFRTQPVSKNCLYSFYLVSLIFRNLILASFNGR